MLWNLTGGAPNGVHVTDVTNASRTMLMNLETLDWDDELLSFFGIPRQMLPEIRPSSSPEPYGMTHPDGPTDGEVPLTASLRRSAGRDGGSGVPQAGEAKNTYGTGNFLLLNTGEKIVRSQNGLLTTVCYQFGDAKPVYALEGSIAVTGSAVQWLRDQPGSSMVRPTANCWHPRSPTTAACTSSRLLRAVRSLLAFRRPRRDRGPVAVQLQRARRPRHPGGDLLPEPRRRRCDGGRLRVKLKVLKGRRRRHPQRTVHADPG